MSNVEVAVHAGMAVAGYEVAQRWIPNKGYLGQYNDLAFGVAVAAAGLYTKKSAVIAFGLGAAVEGLLTVLRI